MAAPRNPQYPNQPRRRNRPPEAYREPVAFDDPELFEREPGIRSPRGGIRTGFGYREEDYRHRGTGYPDDESPWLGREQQYWEQPDLDYAHGDPAPYWGGHRGAEDRFDSGLSDRYGYGRGDFEDPDIYRLRASEYRMTRPPESPPSHPPHLIWRHGGRPDYRGLGPKGYQRSDERILEDVCERLTEHPLVDARDISVTCEQGVVRLEGRVENRMRKHLIEDIVADVSGVKDIRNELEITTGWPGGASGLS